MVKIIKNLLFIISVLSIGLILGACDGNDAGGDAGGDSPINLGVLLPMSGAQAFYGIDMNNAFMLAVDQINESGGVLGRQLNLLAPADDGCDPMMAAQAATLISSSDAHFVVGGFCSGATIAALQEFHDNDLIMVISASNSTRITDMGLSQSFMLNSPATHQVDKLIDLIHHLGVTEVAVIHQGDDFTQNLSDISHQKMPGEGINIVTTQVMEIGVPDASAIVTAIRNAGAELVFWAGYFADGGNMVRQLRQGGFDGYIVAADGSSSTEFITAKGDVGNGVLTLSTPNAQISPRGAIFEADFQERFGTGSGSYAAHAFDTVHVLVAAIEAAGSIEPEAVKQALHNLDYQAIIGRIVFAPNREVYYSNFLVLETRDGEFHLFDF
ncbi:MAG: branched-chain amino acid ABC transporter substrate-binding protein [Defluviitaleaceae bacterium]|nr:branched-chain amino acid ABC transporter substrate-binding protein [Defluviitaleaceae bacterium]